MLLTILRAIQAFRDYHRNLTELSQLTDRELADIGLERTLSGRCRVWRCLRARTASQNPGLRAITVPTFPETVISGP